MIGNVNQFLGREILRKWRGGGSCGVKVAENLTISGIDGSLRVE